MQSGVVAAFALLAAKTWKIPASPFSPRRVPPYKLVNTHKLREQRGLLMGARNFFLAPSIKVFRAASVLHGKMDSVGKFKLNVTLARHTSVILING